jgi:transcriptional regulator with XRE-family HTH domain
MVRRINKNNRVPRQGLIAARVRVGLTRPKLATMLGFARSYVFRVEVGEIDPDVERMTAWLKALGEGAEPSLFERHRSIAKWAGFEPSEDATTAAVLAHWRILGVPGSLVAAIPNKKAHGQPGLTKGLPDLLVISPTLGPSAGFIELKRERGGRMSGDQKSIRDLLIERGAPYALAKGRDEPIRILEEWGAVRRSARAA